MLINTNTLQQLTEQQFRELKPNVSYPAILDGETLAGEGCAVLFPAPQPTYDPITQTVRETTPVLTGKGHWEQSYEVVALDAETVAANQAKAQAAAITTCATALDAHFKATAAERGYDTQYTAALRAGYAGPYQAEGIAFAQWMDACNQIGYDSLAKVEAGTPVPTPQEFIGSLPKMEWPV